MRLKYVVPLLISAITVVVAPVATAQAVAPPAIRSGMEINVRDSIITVSGCTLGAVIAPHRALTAGHCGNVGQPVLDGKENRIGSIVANRIDQGVDIAVIALDPQLRAQVDAIDWSGSFHRGQPVTKQGVTTGFGSGTVIDPTPTMRDANGFDLAPPFLINHVTVSISSTLVARPGDSGGPIREAGGRIVGIMSAASSDNTSVFTPVAALPANLR